MENLESVYRPEFYETKYRVDVTQVSRGENYWKTAKCSVVDVTKNVPIFEYERGYPSLFNTFCPFEHNGRMYALYSAQYTCTELLDLETGKRIGGESPESCGFCPVDFYVPVYDRYTLKKGEETKSLDVKILRKGDESWTDIPDEYDMYYVTKSQKEGWEIVQCQRKNFDSGFVAGCVWGDDSSWKIQFLDLSKVSDGKVNRVKDLLGYVEMPRNAKRLSELIKQYVLIQTIST